MYVSQIIWSTLSIFADDSEIVNQIKLCSMNLWEKGKMLKAENSLAGEDEQGGLFSPVTSDTYLDHLCGE